MPLLQLSRQSSFFTGVVTRRDALVGLAASAWPALPVWAADVTGNVTSLLSSGGCVVVLRHAATVPGVGDPPEFKLDECRTQRNLSDAGQQDARRIGAWFRNSKLPQPRAVLTSAWCRCKDTADLAFGKHTVWPALNSTFSDRALQPEQSQLLRQAMAKIPARQFEVWVTHQVNISALTGEVPAMGEAFVLDRKGRVLARTVFV
ncbi:MAG TPA: histidine phosphatase family protein [Burkholderiaceae bacterium]|nr:histidine phosphatase family protein [Burkholderiaceae bacterium]